MSSQRTSKQASRDIMSLFLRIVYKYNAMEKIPVAHGKKTAKIELYHSERHMLDVIADGAGRNISQHAAELGVTKGAISQIARKLEEKGFIKRVKRGGNDKEVYLELTGKGTRVAEQRKQLNEEMLMPLVKELGRHSDQEVAFLVSMFRWLDSFFQESQAQMEAEARK